MLNQNTTLNSKLKLIDVISSDYVGGFTIKMGMKYKKTKKNQKAVFSLP